MCAMNLCSSPRLWRDLGEFYLMTGHKLGFAVEQQEACALCALVDRSHALHLL